MWAIRGRIVPLSSDRAVAPDSAAVFTGRVWVDDDGTIAAITRGSQAGPAGSDGAQVIDVGSSLVMPGLIDLHNHLAYNTLPLWTEPAQQTPFLHHNSWTRAKTYAASTTWPAYALITACPQELLAHVEAKAIVGGTTSIQGSPPKNRPRDGWLVRNIEDETFGSGNANLIYASVLTAKPAALAERANKMRAGSAFIYHCSEGQRGSIAAREFADAEAAGCLQPRFIAVHANAVDPAVYAHWQSPGAIAWSPFSNLWLYGQTSDVPAARSVGINVCIGSDWAPSGTKNVLGELKSARLTADHRGWSLSDHDLVMMATCLPGDTLARAWGRQLAPMQLSLSQPSDATKAWEWSEVIDRMEEVRAHPRREVEAANAMYARWAGRLDDRDAPLRLALDMPTGWHRSAAYPRISMSWRSHRCNL
jgi:cytosine/adenosine deaminase-related metal-dependent hydrolase